MERPKHPRKELERLLQDVEDKGWVVKKTTYYEIKCPCGKHMRWVHLTPRGRDYEKDVRRWLKNKTCWGRK